MRLKSELLLRKIRRKRKKEGKLDDHSTPIYKIRFHPLCQLMILDIKIYPAHRANTIGYIIHGPEYEVYDEVEERLTGFRYAVVKTSSISKDDILMNLNYRHMFREYTSKENKTKYGYIWLNTKFIEVLPIKENQT